MAVRRFLNGLSRRADPALYLVCGATSLRFREQWESKREVSLPSARQWLGRLAGERGRAGVSRVVGILRPRFDTTGTVFYNIRPQAGIEPNGLSLFLWFFFVAVRRD